MRGLKDKHLAGQGLYHTTATSLLQDDGPLPPGQNGLKLPLGPGLPPPPHLNWGQIRAGSGPSTTEPLIQPSWVMMSALRAEGPLPAARRSDWTFSIQASASAVCPSPPRLPHIIGYVRNTAPVL